MNRVEIKRKQILGFTQLLWIITWVVLGRMICDNGVTYLAVAIEGMSFMVSLLAERVPDALGRMLRGRYARGQFKNADIVKRGALIWQAVWAAIGGSVLFLLAGILTEKVFLIPYGMLAMRILSVAVTVRVLSCVFLGYFQGRGVQIPTIMVAVLRQLFYLGLCILFVNKLKAYGAKVEPLLLDDALSSMYGAAGMAAAIVVTELFLLLFIVLLYLGSHKKKEEQGLKRTENFVSTVTGLFGNAAPYTTVDLLVRMPVWLGLLFYMRAFGQAENAEWVYGTYYSGYLLVMSIPIIIVSCLLHPLAARTAVSARKGESRLAKDIAGASLHGGFCGGLFLTVMFAVLHKQFASIFAVREVADVMIVAEVTVSDMICKGSPVILFAILSGVCIRILIYMGKNSKVLCSLFGYVAAFVIGAWLCLHTWELDIAGLVYGVCIAAAVLCLVSGFLVIRQLRIKMNLLYWFAIPMGAAAVSGLICIVLEKILASHMGTAVLIVCLPISMIVYLAVLILFHSFDRQEFEYLPGGKLLFGLCEMVGIKL